MLDPVLYPFESLDRSALALFMIAVLSSYLGVYVVVKRIVFVGVALAEASAMGIGFAFFAAGWAAGIGIDHHAWEETAPLVFSIAFTLIGVVLFGIHHSGKRVSQEGLIGVGYAIAAGLAVLLIFESAEGLDKLKNLVAGDELFLGDLAFRVLVWTFFGLFAVHLALRKEFLFSSFDKETARSLNLPARILDLVLYLSLGVAVAVSLRAGSILVVVGLMILPPVSAMLVARRFGHVQLLSVAIAVAATGAGILGSFRIGDGLPVAPTIVAALAAIFLGALAACRWAAARHVFVGLAGSLAALAIGLGGVSLSHYAFGTRLSGPEVASAPGDRARTHEERLADVELLLDSELPRDRIEAARRLSTWDDPHATELLLEALGDEDATVRREAIQALGSSKSPRAADALILYMGRRRPDAGMEFDLAEALLRLRHPEGLHALVHLLERDDAPPFFRVKAHRRLVELTGQSLPASDRHGWEDWWEQNHDRLRWDEPSGRFVTQGP